MIGLAGESVRAQIDTAYRLAYSRPADAKPMDLALRFSRRHREIVAERASKHQDLALPEPMTEGQSPIGGAVLVGLCHLAKTSCEFNYLN